MDINILILLLILSIVSSNSLIKTSDNKDQNSDDDKDYNSDDDKDYNSDENDDDDGTLLLVLMMVAIGIPVLITMILI